MTDFPPLGSDGTQFAGYPFVTSVLPTDIFLLQRQSAPGPIGSVAILASNFVPAQIYDIGMCFDGSPPVSSTILVFKTPRPITFPALLPASVFSVQSAPTSSVQLSIQQNGTVIGTLTWAAASAVPVVSFPAQAHFVAGDELRIITPGTIYGMATLALTFVAMPF